MAEQTLEERIRYINTHMVDLVKHYVLDHIGEDDLDKDDEPDQPKQPGDGDGDGEEETIGAPGAGGDDDGSEGSGDGGEPIDGGHSRKSSDGASELAAKLDVLLAPPTKWVRGGKTRVTWEEIYNLPKWHTFRSVRDFLKKQWKTLVNESVIRVERGNIIGDNFNSYDYINDKGLYRYFDKVEVPDNEPPELNIILALDASGSTGYDRQYYMSGVAFAMKRAMEEMRVRHSMLVFDHQLAVLDLNQEGLSEGGYPMILNYNGSGGTDERLVLAAAKEIAMQNKDKQNVVIIISDGAIGGVDNTLNELKAATNGTANAYCVGYGSDFDLLRAQEVFGEQFVHASRNNRDFAMSMIKIIEKELVNNMKRGQND